MKNYFNIIALLILIACSNIMAFAEERSSNNPEHTSSNCPLPPPSVVKVRDLTSNSVTLEWSRVTNAALYMVKLENLTTGTLIATEFTQDTSMFFNNLIVGHWYRGTISATSGLKT